MSDTPPFVMAGLDPATQPPRVDAASESPPQEETASEDYALVEIFGHRRHFGRIVEVERFGHKLLRVDVPKDGKFELGHTSHFYGGASIFSLTPCDLATVERANRPGPSAGRISYHDPDVDDDSGDHEDDTF